ncbi:MAG: hypothetical protein J0L51_14380 [Rhizobiales bacterium]|nr:hypothetical protein [Hyphomicrobiales bacterium]
MKKPLRFGTLGTEGSNHSMIVRQYIAFRGLNGAEVTLFTDFREAFDALVSGELDFVLQVSVHPSHTEMSARYVHRVHVVDTFIAPSKSLAIISRTDVESPQSIAFQPATKHYADLSAWPRQIDEVSIMTVAEGLQEGRFDSGITSVELVEQAPDRFRIDQLFGPITDVWVLFGRQPLDIRSLSAWPDAPVCRHFSE